MTYSLQFRQHVLKIRKQEGLSYAETAERFGIGIASLMRWNKRPEPKTTRNRAATKIDADALRRDVEDYPDAYQYERAERFKVSTRGICDALRRLKISRKKKP